MKRSNRFTYIWVIGIYLILLIILLLVVEYKVKYEDHTFYNYLYFYKCNNKLCSTDNFEKIEDKSTLLSVYKYNYKDDIPTYEYIVSDYVLINDNNKYVYYDYVKGEIINNYSEYRVVKKDNIANYLIVKNETKYGIIDVDNKVVVDFKYDDIIHSNNLFIVKEGTGYNIINIEDKKILNNNSDYIYIDSSVIIEIKDNKLDILDLSGKSKLKEKVSVIYSNEVKVTKKDDIINISIDNINYKYDIKNNTVTKE